MRELLNDKWYSPDKIVDEYLAIYDECETSTPTGERIPNYALKFKILNRLSEMAWYAAKERPGGGINILLALQNR